MSQARVYEILQFLGGEATTKAIREEAYKRYPSLTLHTYVTNRLKKLEKYGVVERSESDKGVSWKILREL